MRRCPWAISFEPLNPTRLQEPSWPVGTGLANGPVHFHLGELVYATERTPYCRMPGGIIPVLYERRRITTQDSLGAYN